MVLYHGLRVHDLSRRVLWDLLLSVILMTVYRAITWQSRESI